MLHGDSLRELAEHPLLEGLQPLVVVATAHVFFILLQRGEHTLCPVCGPAPTWAQPLLISQARPEAEVGPGHNAQFLSTGGDGLKGKKGKLHWEVTAGRHKLLADGGHPGRGARWGWDSEKRPEGPDGSAWERGVGGAIYVGTAPTRATTAGQAEAQLEEGGKLAGDDWEAWVCVAQGLLLVTRRNQCPGAGRDSGIVYCSDSFANVSAEQTDMILSTHFMFTFGLGEVSFSPLAGLKSHQGTLSFLPCLPPAGEFP